MNEKPNFSSPEHYKEMFTEEERNKHLTLEEAQDKANQMRSVIGINPKNTGTVNWKKDKKDELLDRVKYADQLHEWRKINTDVTKKDYKLALEKVEEIEKLANEETSEEEFEFKLKKILQVGGQVLVSAVLVPLDLITFGPRAMDKMLEKFKENREKLVDAKTVLKNLIKEGDKFGELEKKYNRQETV